MSTSPNSSRAAITPSACHTASTSSDPSLSTPDSSLARTRIACTTNRGCDPGSAWASAKATGRLRFGHRHRRIRFRQGRRHRWILADGVGDGHRRRNRRGAIAPVPATRARGSARWSCWTCILRPPGRVDANGPITRRSSRGGRCGLEEGAPPGVRDASPVRRTGRSVPWRVCCVSASGSCSSWVRAAASGGRPHCWRGRGAVVVPLIRMLPVSTRRSTRCEEGAATSSCGSSMSPTGRTSPRRSMPWPPTWDRSTACSPTPASCLRRSPWRRSIGSSGIGCCV